MLEIRAGEFFLDGVDKTAGGSLRNELQGKVGNRILGCHPPETILNIVIIYHVTMGDEILLVARDHGILHPHIAHRLLGK